MSKSLIDNYVDTNTLNIINHQYPELKLNYTYRFHDRFLIIDNKKVYHIGASLKDAGKKCFAISLMNDNSVVDDILNRLES